MTKDGLIGLGEPEQTGKRSFFQPSTEIIPKKMTKDSENNQSTSHDYLEKRKRIRSTIELSNQTLNSIQSIQFAYRIKTGKVLTLQKLLRIAIDQLSKVGLEQLYET